MPKSRILCVCVVFLLSARHFASAAAPAITPSEELLATKGLVRVGITYLLDPDVNLRPRLKTMRQAKARLESAVARRSEIEDQLRDADVAVIQGLDRIVEINRQMDKVKKVPVRYNELLAQVHSAEAQLAEIKVYVADREKALARIDVPNDQYVSAAVELSDAMEAAQRQYDVLAADPGVKAALAEINKTAKPAVTLGPSEQFKRELSSVRRERAKIKAEGIKLTFDGGVPTINAMLNDKAEIRMVVDSGASDILLSAEAAHQAGLDDEPAIARSRGLSADGKVTEADVKLIKSLRVGQFVVENVLCSIARKGEGSMNLLGGEFLHHFVYRMDLEGGQLYLSPIGAKTERPDAAAGTDDRPAKPETAGPGGSAKMQPPSIPVVPPYAKDKPSNDSGGGDRRTNGKWLILFRSAYPSLWDTPVSDSQSYAIPLDQAPASMAYLRIRNAEGNFVIIPLTREELTKRVIRDKSGWEGRDYDKNGGRHLGVFVKAMRRVDTGSIDVTPANNNSGYTGYGFGNRVNVDDHQGYVWAGKPVEKDVIEIAVTSRPLSEEEQHNLLAE
jgi:clan AA aspartic protease (TIGR02281 family)